jgi:hypothetical protein
MPNASKRGFVGVDRRELLDDLVERAPHQLGAEDAVVRSAGCQCRADVVAVFHAVVIGGGEPPTVGPQLLVGLSKVRLGSARDAGGLQQAE